jgi:hypothetical protein
LRSNQRREGIDEQETKPRNTKKPWLNAPYTGATPLHPGTTWRYLDFFFDHALTFCEYIKHYMNKALTTVRAMLALGNSVCGQWPKHK